MALRFHLDEHVSHAVAHALTLRGVDVTTTHDTGLSAAGDEVHVAFARREQRVIYTQDSDFLLLAARGAEHCGIIYSVPGDRTLRQIIEFLILANGCLSSEEMINAIEFIPA